MDIISDDIERITRQNAKNLFNQHFVLSLANRNFVKNVEHGNKSQYKI